MNPDQNRTTDRKTERQKERMEREGKGRKRKEKDKDKKRGPGNSPLPGKLSANCGTIQLKDSFSGGAFPKGEKRKHYCVPGDGEWKDLHRSEVDSVLQRAVAPGEKGDLPGK